EEEKRKKTVRSTRAPRQPACANDAAPMAGRPEEQQLWADSARFLDETGAAMAEIEERFRTESVAQACRQSDLEDELRAARARLQEAPRALSDARQAVEAARVAWSARAAALASGLRGVA
ncbi:unnamed protein product, partial [Prorocentrum cordatum]